MSSSLLMVRRSRSISRGRDRPVRSFRSAGCRNRVTRYISGSSRTSTTRSRFRRRCGSSHCCRRRPRTANRSVSVWQRRNLVPPVNLVWEYRPKADQDVWLRLNVLADESVAFTRDGYIDVEGPQSIEPSIEPSLKTLVAEKRYWVRVRLDQNTYPAGHPARLEFFVPNSVDAVNLQTERRLEPIGQSNGNANQTFDVPKRPVQTGSLKLEVRPASGDPETDWIEVPDLIKSKPNDRHYQLDAALGRITFGDGNRGVIPTSGAAIVATVWRYGGGTAANSIEAGAIKTIVDQTQGIEKVTNVRRPAGGADEEPLQDFKRRAPGELRRNGRAISKGDFETIARSIGGVRGVKALGGRHPTFRMSPCPAPLPCSSSRTRIRCRRARPPSC